MGRVRDNWRIGKKKGKGGDETNRRGLVTFIYNLLIKTGVRDMHGRHNNFGLSIYFRFQLKGRHGTDGRTGELTNE